MTITVRIQHMQPDSDQSITVSEMEFDYPDCWCCRDFEILPGGSVDLILQPGHYLKVEE